jgi:deazaflavin-dependent oxidoreductase (nitroreductase family)
MWFMNHVFNPILRWILTSPLHKMMSNDVALIAFRGKKSGREYITPVQFARSGQVVWIIVGFPEKKRWWHNLVGGADVRLCLQRQWLTGRATLLQGEADQAEIIAGLNEMTRKYPSAKSTQYGLDNPAFSTSDRVVVRVDLK